MDRDATDGFGGRSRLNGKRQNCGDSKYCQYGKTTH
jgi:hypothetical protein